MRFLSCGHIVGSDSDAERQLDGSFARWCWSCRRYIPVVDDAPESVREFVQRCEAWETDRETL